MKKVFFIFLFVVSSISVNNLMAQQNNNTLTESTPVFASGEIICSESANQDGLRLSARSYDEFIIGVYQKKESQNTDADKFMIKNPVLRNGVIALKYNSENGAIKKGDLLTSSSQQGVAMKATKSGMIVGIALEDASASSGSVKTRVLIQYLKQ